MRERPDLQQSPTMLEVLRSSGLSLLGVAAAYQATVTLLVAPLSAAAWAGAISAASAGSMAVVNSSLVRLVSSPTSLLLILSAWLVALAAVRIAAGASAILVLDSKGSVLRAMLEGTRQLGSLLSIALWQYGMLLGVQPACDRGGCWRVSSGIWTARPGGCLCAQSADDHLDRVSSGTGGDPSHGVSLVALDSRDRRLRGRGCERPCGAAQELAAHERELDPDRSRLPDARSDNRPDRRRESRPDPGRDPRRRPRRQPRHTRGADRARLPHCATSDARSIRRDQRLCAVALPARQRQNPRRP